MPEAAAGLLLVAFNYVLAVLLLKPRLIIHTVDRRATAQYQNNNTT